MEMSVRFDDDTVSFFRHAFFSCTNNKDKMSKKQFKEFFLMKDNDDLDSADPSLFVFLDQVFSAFDAKGKGFLSFDDLLKNMDVICKGTKHDKLRSLFKICDFKKKGRIEERDFVALCQSLAFVRNDNLAHLAKKARLLYAKSLDGHSTCPKYMNENQFVELIDSDRDFRNLVLQAITSCFFN